MLEDFLGQSLPAPYPCLSLQWKSFPKEGPLVCQASEPGNLPK